MALIISLCGMLGNFLRIFSWFSIFCDVLHNYSMLKVIILTDFCTLLGCIPSFHEQTIKGCDGSVYDFINYFFFHAFFNSVIYIPCDATVVFSCQILI